MPNMSKWIFVFSFLWSVFVTAATCTDIKIDDLPKTPLQKSACYSLTFRANVLARDIAYNVVLPTGYPFKTQKPYAIFLHGRNGTPHQIIDLGVVEEMDKLIAEGQPPFLVFSPAGGNHYWMNAAISKEHWGSMVTRDFVRHIETMYKVVPNEPSRRALFGISMGGNGTVQLGFTDEGRFETALALSPVFRRDQDIWHPRSNSQEPRGDHDAYGTGDDYRARSARHLCEARSKKTGRPDCLPFKNFKLDIGPEDALLNNYPDTRKFIQELKLNHPKFDIGLKKCEIASYCTNGKGCQGHEYGYWKCRLPENLRWLSLKLK